MKTNLLYSKSKSESRPKNSFPATSWVMFDQQLGTITNPNWRIKLTIAGYNTKSCWWRFSYVVVPEKCYQLLTEFKNAVHESCEFWFYSGTLQKAIALETVCQLTLSSCSKGAGEKPVSMNFLAGRYMESGIHHSKRLLLIIIKEVLIFIWEDERIWGHWNSSSMYWNYWGVHIFKTQNSAFCFLPWIPFSVCCRSVTAIANDLILVELDGRQYSLFYHYLPLDHKLNQGLGDISWPVCPTELRKFIPGSGEDVPFPVSRVVPLQLNLYRTLVVSCWVVAKFYNPKDCSPPGSFVHGISQARILEWVAISFSTGSS